jgi:hypothetical protein
MSDGDRERPVALTDIIAVVRGILSHHMSRTLYEIRRGDCMTDVRGETIESRQATVAAWLAPGLAIDVVPPTSANTSYTATLAELDLIGTGKTEDEALEALLMQLNDFMAAYLLNGGTLPDRGSPLSAHIDPLSGAGDA